MLQNAQYKTANYITHNAAKHTMQQNAQLQNAQIPKNGKKSKKVHWSSNSIKFLILIF